LIRDDGVAKISDFGISRSVGDPTLTQSGFMSGTPSYFSPALARGAEPGPADDVWALGATLYAGVEGRSPYDRRRNPVEVLHEINSTQPPQPKRAGFLEHALQRMLDRDPGSRWSMDDAAHTLRRLADSHRPEATLQSTRPTPAQAPPRLIRSPKLTPSRSSKLTPSRSSKLTPSPSSRRGYTRPALVAVALLVIVGGVFATSRLLSNQKPNGAAGQQASTTAKTSKNGAGSGGGSASSGKVSKESFVRDYYAKAPGGSDQAWAMLGPGEQAQGRDSYLGFWRTIKSVDVTDVHARSGSDTVDVTLTYRTTDGRVSTEHKRERLSTTEGGGYLLESDDPAG
jgi:serine/threonine protein kinase